MILHIVMFLLISSSAVGVPLISEEDCPNKQDICSACKNIFQEVKDLLPSDNSALTIEDYVKAVRVSFYKKTLTLTKEIVKFYI